MAKALLQRKVEEEGLSHLILVDSAGTWAMDGNPAAENTEEVCLENDLDVTDHRSKHISSALLENADLVLCMEAHHKRDLLSIFPQYKDKIFVLTEFGAEDRRKSKGIPDPIGKGISAYRKTFKLIASEIDRIFPHIKRRVLESNQKRGD